MAGSSNTRAAAAAAFSAGFLAAWFATTVLPVKLLWYLPAERRFAFELHPQGLGIDFYGRLLWAIAAGAAACAVVYVALRGREVSSGALRMLWIWCLSLLLLDAGLYAFTLMHREPLPLPLPDVHVDR